MGTKKASFPLLFASIGQAYQIERLIGDDKIMKHLHDIGFYNGAVIKVLSKMEGGLLVNLLNTKLAIDSNICSKIYVSELEHKNVIEIEK